MGIMEQFGFPSAAQAKQELFDAMRTHGVWHLEAHYSGGNDEGGVDEIEVMKDSVGEDVVIENMTWQHPLHQAADNMLSTEFGTWAGDFSAYGVLFADLGQRKVWRQGQQSSYADDGQEY